MVFGSERQEEIEKELRNGKGKTVKVLCFLRLLVFPFQHFFSFYFLLSYTSAGWSWSMICSLSFLIIDLHPARFAGLSEAKSFQTDSREAGPGGRPQPSTANRQDK
jgi:hypothetical protein